MCIAQEGIFFLSVQKDVRILFAPMGSEHGSTRKTNLEQFPIRFRVEETVRTSYAHTGEKMGVVGFLRA